MSRKRGEDQYKNALVTRNLEIGLFWQRSLFFWGFIVAVYSSVFSICNTVVKGSVLKEMVEPFIVLALFLTLLGQAFSFAWFLVNRGSKFWQENWERKVEAVEALIVNEDKVLAGAALFDRYYRKTETKFFGAGMFSVSKLTIALSFLISVFALGIGAALSYFVWLNTSSPLREVSIVIYWCLSIGAFFWLWYGCETDLKMIEPLELDRCKDLYRWKPENRFVLKEKQ